MVETIIGFIVVIITVIGWISNAINENKKNPQQPPVNRQPQKRRRLQDELEAFLGEIQGQKKPQQPQQKREQPQRRREPSGNRQKSRSENRPLSSLDAKRNRKERERLSKKKKSVFEERDRKSGRSKTAGSEISEHVKEHISSRHPGTLSQNTSDSNNIGSDAIATAPERKSASGTQARREALELLCQLHSAQTAIVLSEILQPPVSQRPDRF